MRRLLALALVAIGPLISCGQSEQERMNQAVSSLVAKERAFSDKCGSEGLSVAFMSVLADDGLLFRPDPKNGKEIYRANPSIRGLLSWTPGFAEVSRAGDLGYSTGPWEFWKDSSKTGRPSYGEYMSIWRRQGDGPWQLVVDFGLRHTARKWDSSLTTYVPAAKPGWKRLSAEEMQRAKQDLLDVEHAYSEMSKTKGKVEAFEQYTLEPLSYLRPGSERLTTKKDAIVFLDRLPDQLTWEPTAAVVSESGDLGYTYGEMLHRSAFYEEDPGERFAYLHIWRRMEDGTWKVALDITQPLREPKERQGE